jgi:hypothetical protein
MKGNHKHLESLRDDRVIAVNRPVREPSANQRLRRYDDVFRRNNTRRRSHRILHRTNPTFPVVHLDE